MIPRVECGVDDAQAAMSAMEEAVDPVKPAMIGRVFREYFYCSLD